MSPSKKFDNVIIWGYPYGTHTQSYVWLGFYRGFKALGYETHWLARGWSYEKLTKNIDISNTLFIFERNDMEGMPAHPGSTYLFHMMGNRPETDVRSRLSGKVGRLLDMRQHSMNFWDDTTYAYTMDRPEVQLVDPGCFFEKSADGVDNIYVAWATDLLPQEIDLDARFAEREKKIWYIGTVGGGRGGIDDCLPTIEIHDNRPYLRDFREACRENGVEFNTNCPWLNPLNQEQSMDLVKRSFLAPDSRHPTMVNWGYVPCRSMKNVSYGQLGLTNSPAVQKFMEGEVIYEPNGRDLFYKGLSHQKDHEMIRRQMLLVRDKHTYVNRANSILKALEL